MISKFLLFVHIIKKDNVYNSKVLADNCKRVVWNVSIGVVAFMQICLKNILNLQFKLYVRIIHL